MFIDGFYTFISSSVSEYKHLYTTGQSTTLNAELLHINATTTTKTMSPTLSDAFW